VEIVVHPIPRVVSNWLIGIGRVLATLIKLKVTPFTHFPCGALAAFQYQALDAANAMRGVKDFIAACASTIATL